MKTREDAEVVQASGQQFCDPDPFFFYAVGAEVRRFSCASVTYAYGVHQNSPSDSCSDSKSHSSEPSQSENSRVEGFSFHDFTFEQQLRIESFFRMNGGSAPEIVNWARIKSQYRALVFQFHPDRQNDASGEGAEAKELFFEVQEMYLELEKLNEQGVFGQFSEGKAA